MIVAPEPVAALDLADWRRRVTELFAAMRHDASRGELAWRAWRAGRDALFAEHPQSPLGSSAGERERTASAGLPYFDWDSGWRVEARLVELGESDDARARDAEGTALTPIGRLEFSVAGRRCALTAYWLEAYAGGLFVPFLDATSGGSTYGGGRYLLDTAKGADHGCVDGYRDRLVLDFNYAYHPSCRYDPRWACPLAPPQNRLELAVEAGERL